MSRIVILSDRIKELSHTTGQGNFTLDGAATGFSPFQDFYEYGDVVWYAATDGVSYEVGSGEFILDGSTNKLSRNPFRTSNLDAGPYYVNDASSMGSTEGVSGYFFPLYLTKSKASGVAGSTSIHKHAFSGYPGITFWMPNSPMVHGGQVSWLDGSGSSYATSGAPFNFSAGIKEIYVTYPAKYSVTTSYGVSGFKEPEHGGVAFWGSEQSLDYDENFAWDTTNNNLGITQTIPEYALDIGGNIVYSQVRASGFIDGGSGIAFSGGVALPQAATKTASGGRQLEPFFRNELDSHTGSDAVFSLSGLVDERLLLKTQIKGTIFAGPASGCIGSCDPDYPTFRYLEVEDIPDLSSLYLVQKNNIDAGSVPVGAISHWDSSGVIEYDPNFVFLNGTDRLGVGTDEPTNTLSVSGNVRFDGPNHVGCELTASGNSEFGNSVVITNNATIGGNVTVSGNLDVQGDVTYIDSSTVTVFDKQLELASMSGVAVYTDQVINSGGIVLKSTTATSGDKHFIFSEAKGAWYSDQSLLLDAGQKIKFNGGPDISGAYHAGSGLELHNGIEFNVGDLFNAIGDSGTASSLPVSGTIHQGQLLSVSGNAGTHVVFHHDPAGSGLIEINTAALSGWAAASISSAGGMSSWSIEDGLSLTGAEAITNGVLVSFSGVSGIGTHYDHGLNRLEINPGEVSGALQGQIDAVSAPDPYNFIITDGLTIQDVVTMDQSIAISGASGINITLNDAGFGGTNNLGPSGMLFTVHASGLVEDVAVNSASGAAISGWAASTIGGLGGGYGHWKLNASGHNDGFGSFTTDQITSAQAVTVSGLSGITVEYTAGDQGLRIAAPIPFTTHSGVGSSTPHLLSSGLVITPLGASGLHSIDFNPEGSGQLTHLIFNNDIIKIGENAYHHASGSAGSNIDAYHGPTIAIGKNAAVRSSGTYGSIIVGYDAGYESSGNIDIMIGNGAGWRSRSIFNSLDNAGNIYLGRHAASGLHTSALQQDDLGTIAIGFQALADTDHPSYDGATVAVGKNAGYGASFIGPSVLIGEDAGANASGYYSVNDDEGGGTGAAVKEMIAIGHQAAQNSSGIDRPNGSIYIGTLAGANSNNASYTNFIGYLAGYSASGLTAIEHNNFIGHKAGENTRDTTYSNYIGFEAGKNVSGIDYGNAMGYGAAELASGCNYSNFTGYGAGHKAHNTEYCHAVGYYAGADTSGCKYSTMLGHQAGRYAHNSNQSVFIGLYAGRKYGGTQAIIIKNNSDLNTGAPWEDQMINGAIDIGHIIQGQSSPDGLAKRLRLGASLSQTADLDGNCVSIKSNSPTDVTLRLIPSTSQTVDQLASSKNGGATKHRIIDSDGMLHIPVAYSYTGGELYTSATTQDNTTKIVKSNGVVAAYSVAGDEHLVVCIGTTWYRTSNTLAAL